MPNHTDDSGRLSDHTDFSLVLGGPLYQLLRRSRLSGDALELLHRRILFLTLCTWLPPLILILLEGHPAGRTVAVPFLLDVEFHVRFLAVLPLLILAELIVHQRLRGIVNLFLDRQLIPPGGERQFRDAVESALRWRNSVPAELLLIAFVYGFGILVVWRQYVALDADTWYATPSSDGPQLTLAGVWYSYVSLPLFQFILCRWYFRLLIWMRFLWQVSRIPLRLVATHPDRAGGLGFLVNTVHAFVPIVMAHGALVAGWIANRIFYKSAALQDFIVEIFVAVVFLLCIVLGPLLVFAVQLAGAKRTGIREYGTLAACYARDFDAKWLRGDNPDDERLLGSADIQSLADMGNSFEVVQSMRLAPFSKATVLELVILAMAPMGPLALTMMSLEDLLARLVGILF